MTRNLGAETFDENKIYFDSIFNKEDFWPEPDNMYNYSGMIYTEEIYSKLETKYIYEFLQL